MELPEGVVVGADGAGAKADSAQVAEAPLHGGGRYEGVRVHDAGGTRLCVLDGDETEVGEPRFEVVVEEERVNPMAPRTSSWST